METNKRSVQAEMSTINISERVCFSISGVTVSSWKLMHVHLEFQLPTIPREPVSRI